MSSTLESYELIRFAEAFEARLATAEEMLAAQPGLEPEKGWLSTALQLVRTARVPTLGLLERVKDLPELEEAREEYAFHQQGQWVDALEKLHAGITFTASSRAPVIEALFPHLKFPQLRRAPRDTVTEFATSYERRLKSAYVTRILGRDDFAMVRPVVDQVATAYAAWKSSHEPAPLTAEQEAALREELVALGRKLDVALRQARLLSEAALVPMPGVFEAAGLSLKPKRRAGRGLSSVAEEGLAGLLEEPVDPMEPTEAELAEVAALDAEGGAGEEAPRPAEDAPHAEATPAADAPGTAVEGMKAGALDSSAAQAPTPAPAPVAAAAAPEHPEALTSEAAAPSREGDNASAAPVETASSGETEARGGARRGRRKASDAQPLPKTEAAPPSPPAGEGAVAQAPRVRRKRTGSSVPSGAETP